jgi:membrane associated rhomboid family serine protease
MRAIANKPERRNCLIVTGILFLGYALFLFSSQLILEIFLGKERLFFWWKRIASVKGSLALGFSLILIYYRTSEGRWQESSEATLRLFGLWKGPEFHCFQFLTSNFIHANLNHLLNNLVYLGLLSGYERRKGTGWFFLVFLFSGLFSAILFYPFVPSNAVCYGASEGLYGLAAAYLTDFEQLFFKEWIAKSLMALALAGFYTFTQGMIEKNISINHAGHLLGAVGGILVCRAFKGKRALEGGTFTGEAF